MGKSLAEESSFDNLLGNINKPFIQKRLCDPQIESQDFDIWAISAC